MNWRPDFLFQDPPFQHLKVLLDTGLVSVHAEGTKRLYEINHHGMLKLNIWLDQFWQD
jgi:hypothetical protein